jgi:hypothetical protein
MPSMLYLSNFPLTKIKSGKEKNKIMMKSRNGRGFKKIYLKKKLKKKDQKWKEGEKERRRRSNKDEE